MAEQYWEVDLVVLYSNGGLMKLDNFKLQKVSLISRNTFHHFIKEPGSVDSVTVDMG